MEVPPPVGNSGVKLPSDLSLTQILNALELDAAGAQWRLEWINAVWWEGYESPWDSSWNEPLEVSSATLRDQAADNRQIINGRLTAMVANEAVATVEAVDSSYWFIWSDDGQLLDRVRSRVPTSELVTPPSDFHPHG